MNSKWRLLSCSYWWKCCLAKDSKWSNCKWTMSNRFLFYFFSILFFFSFLFFFNSVSNIKIIDRGWSGKPTRTCSPGSQWLGIRDPCHGIIITSS